MEPYALATLETLNGYRRYFMDPGLWKPFVENICRAHGLTCTSVRAAMPGTFPTFIIDDQWVAKFFGQLFDGETCWRVECEAARLMAGVPVIPVARLMADGKLERVPGWHYLIFEYITGTSIGEVVGEVTFEDKLSLARWLGTALPKMHRLEIPEGTTLSDLTLERMKGWFTRRWSLERQKWPVHLAGQVERYLQENAVLLQNGADSFIHADLTRDHLLGRSENGVWTTMAVIDFGDAMRGNIYYELAALHLDMFDCDRRLLRAFTETYGLLPDPDFIRKAMTTALMHQFDVFDPLFERKPQLAEIRTLEALAEELWKIDD
jgi:hypothetical protein